MQNYSSVFAEVLAEYESPYVPGDQGDAGKGQVTARAGERIHRTLDPNVGYIAKSPGQTQYHGIAVDALMDRRDGSGADYLTDILQPDGRRLIALAYTAYPPAPPDHTDWASTWVEPTEAHTQLGGPLVLKGDPAPTPVPPTDTDAFVLEALEDITATQAVHTDILEGLRVQQTNDTQTVLAAVDGVLTRINQIVEDVEESLRKAGIAVFIRRHPDIEEPAP